jgi:type IV secretion system protein VirD4
MPILRPEEIRQLPERHALVVAENTRPILAKLTRCIDGKPGRQLLDQQKAARAQLSHLLRTTLMPARTQVVLSQKQAREPGPTGDQQ